MKKGLFLVTLMLMLLLTNSPQIDYHQSNNSVIPPVSVYNSESFPTFYAVDIPWFKQETPTSCGAASLKSAFGQLGWHINESEIRVVAHTTSSTVTGDMIRAAHFSNLSKAGDDQVIHGYTGKSTGTDSIEMTMLGYDQYGREYTSEFLKQQLLDGRPIILLMSYSADSSSGHYRVLRGYDTRTNSFLFIDPWQSNAQSGSHWSVTETELYEDFWDYSGYWLQVLDPWNISLHPLDTPTGNEIFRLNATITTGYENPREYPWSLDNSSLHLKLPSGYSVVSGMEITEFELDRLGTAQVSWQIQAPSVIDELDTITAEVTGWIHGNGSHPWAVEDFNYTDMIHHETSTSLVDWSPPAVNDLTVSINPTGSLTVNASLSDEHAIHNVTLQWRLSATNWTAIEMDNLEIGLWEVSNLIPSSTEGEVIQMQVISVDWFGNSGLSPIFECDISNSTSSITTSPSLTSTISTAPTTVHCFIRKLEHQSEALPETALGMTL